MEEHEEDDAHRQHALARRERPVDLLHMLLAEAELDPEVAVCAHAFGELEWICAHTASVRTLGVAQRPRLRLVEWVKEGVCPRADGFCHLLWHSAAAIAIAIATTIASHGKVELVKVSAQRVAHEALEDALEDIPVCCSHHVVISRGAQVPPHPFVLPVTRRPDHA